jgi:hypothetical protein
VVAAIFDRLKHFYDNERFSQMLLNIIDDLQGLRPQAINAIGERVTIPERAISDPVIERVRALAKDPHVDVRDQVAHALGKIGTRYPNRLSPSGLFSFDKYSSVNVLIEAARDAAGQPDSQRRLFVVPNAHVTQLNTANGAVSSIDVFVNGVKQNLPVRANCGVILAAGTIESTRLALHSFPTSPNNPAQELMGRNLMAHIRSNIFVSIKRSAIDPGNTLPNALQTAALIVRGSTAQGKFHMQVTASADPAGNSDDLLFAMIPDIDLLDATLANQTAGSISIGFRGVSQLIGDQATSAPNAAGSLPNGLSPFEVRGIGRRSNLRSAPRCSVATWLTWSAAHAIPLSERL